MCKPDLTMCCGTTCDKEATAQYVNILETALMLALGYPDVQLGDIRDLPAGLTNDELHRVTNEVVDRRVIDRNL